MRRRVQQRGGMVTRLSHLPLMAPPWRPPPPWGCGIDATGQPLADKEGELGTREEDTPDGPMNMA
eukprot:599622-Lingulodinium_polyedra.AAC.1